mgnify:FL=1
MNPKTGVNTMKSLRTLTTGVAAAAIAVGLAISPAMAEKVLKLSHLNPADPFNNNSGAMTAVFKSLVDAGTNGSIKVQLFSDGQLGKDNEVIEQTKNGVI